MYTIYWIKHKQHTNILSEGYVGFSSNVDERFIAHKKAKTLVGNKIRKYSNDIEYIILENYEDREKALLREKELRPSKRIGWNVAIGGQTPPNNKNDENVKLKISNTLKRLGMNPYCEKTHSKESIDKRKQSCKKANRKMFHDPVSGEYKFIAIGLGEQIPDNWVPGRVKRVEKTKKIRGIDYDCRSKFVIAVDPEGIEYETTNLKKFCRDMNIPYLATFRGGRWKGWSIK